MAIGDTVQAGLMRVDFSPFLEAGRANAAANASFGQALGQVAKGFIEGQQKKKRASEIAGFLMGQGVGEKDAMAIAKNPFLQNEYQRKQEAEAKMKMEKERLATQSNIAAQGRAQRQAELEEGYRRQDEGKAETEAFYDRLNDTIATDELTPEAQQKIENFSSVVNPNDPRRSAQVNDPQAFMERVQNDPSSYVQKPVYELQGRDFLSQFEDPGMFQKALAFQQANQPKAQKIARTITMQDGKGGFTQVGVDEAGNPIRDFGPPKPSGMYPTPKEKTEEIIAVNRTKDAMQTIKDKVNESNLAIKQAEQAELALTNLPETTGGITSFINDMKVLAESVGIDLPDEYQEDMKDIGIFRQVTGQFLFDAMENTKGSITENEMTLFRRISPDIDNSRAANEGMLKLYVKAGRRAKERKDLIRLSQKQRVDPILIQEKIEKFDEENSLMGDIQALAPNSDTKTKFNFNGQNIDVEIVGERKDGTPIYKDKKTGQVLVQQPAQ